MREKTIPEIAIELTAEIKDIISEVRELDLKTMSGRLNLIPLVVRYVETISKNGELFKEDKKDVAIEIIDILITDPFIPENLDTTLTHRDVYGLLVDQVVVVFNRLFGGIWVDEV